MKHLMKAQLILLSAIFLTSCNDKIEETFMVNEPVYMDYKELRSSFTIKSAQDIIQPGKLYFKDKIIFINEYQKGIHVVNNENPKSPKVLKFIEIPGNVDLAVKGDILYADSYVDLLAIDISNLDDIKVVSRVENAFPYIIPQIENGIIERVDEKQGVVTGWKRIEKTEKVESSSQNPRFYKSWDLIEGSRMDANLSGPTGGGSEFGVGGSMARFTLYNNYLYAVDESSLKLFNISDAKKPAKDTVLRIGWNIETIFPYNGKLFIGSRTGLYIYSLSNPSLPEFISQFRHASSCDPVVVEGNLAYVTLRAGNLCGNNKSQLDVVDISNITNPKLLKEYAMEEPYGLGIDDSILFVCDGNAGLKIYNAKDPLKIDENKLAAYPHINAFDVIPLGNVLLMIGVDGLYQYDYSNLDSIKQLSYIPIYSKKE